MARFLGRLIGLAINLILIPISLLIAIPMAILKVRRDQKSRLLFTGAEQSLLAKAQRVINQANNALILPDESLLEVATCIEEARVDYQLIKGRERLDATFSDFVVPRIIRCHVEDWGKVLDFFEISSLDSQAVEELCGRAVSVEDLLQALKNYISDYERKHGIPPDMVMLDHKVSMRFANAGVYRNTKFHFGETEIIPVAGIPGGLTWKAREPVVKPFENEDCELPF